MAGMEYANAQHNPISASTAHRPGRVFGFVFIGTSDLLRLFRRATSRYVLSDVVAIPTQITTEPGTKVSHWIFEYWAFTQIQGRDFTTRMTSLGMSAALLA